MSKQNTIKNNVYKLIQKYPSLADNDRQLVEMYWYEISNWSDSKTMNWNIRRVASWDRIVRARRELHQEGRVEYSEAIEEKRYKSFIKKREEYSTKSGRGFLSRLIGGMK